MKNTIGILLLFIQSTIAFGSSDPVLIDISVTGSMEAPTFEPQSLKLDLNNSYLLVIQNDKSHSVGFHYEAFGQSVFTHALNGTNSVNVDSFILPPKSRVQWHFETSKPGEYVLYASNTSMNQKGAPGKIQVGEMNKEVKEKELSEKEGARQMSKKKEAINLRNSRRS